MNAKNAAELLAQPDIDGGLIGGASLKPDRLRHHHCGNPTRNNRGAISYEQKHAVLIIMDGFGIAPATPGNAITAAKTPNLDKLFGEISPHPASGASAA